MFIWDSYLDSCFRPSQYAGEGKISRSKHQMQSSNYVFISGHCIFTTCVDCKAQKGSVVDFALKSFAMGRKNSPPETTTLSESVQEALLKAAARKKRCSKEDQPHEEAGGLHPICITGLGQVVEFQVKIFPTQFWHNLDLDSTKLTCELVLGRLMA